MSIMSLDLVGVVRAPGLTFAGLVSIPLCWLASRFLSPVSFSEPHGQPSPPTVPTYPFWAVGGLARVYVGRILSRPTYVDQRFSQPTYPVTEKTDS